MPRRLFAAFALLLVLTGCEQPAEAPSSLAARETQPVTSSVAPRAVATTPPPKSVTPRPTATKAAVVATPKPAPTTVKPKPAPTTTKPKAAVSTCGAPANPWGYTFCGGGFVYNPPASFCSYFDCIDSFWENTKGYVMRCDDGTFSHSGGRSGSCSWHGGNDRPLYG